jgi:hypothetical protein
MRHINILLVAILAITILACNPPETNEKSIVGTWEITGVETNDTTDKIGPMLIGVTMAMSGITEIEFTADNRMTFKDENGQEIQADTYLVEKDGTSLSWTREDETENYEITYSDTNTVSLTSADGMTLILRVK